MVFCREGTDTMLDSDSVGNIETLNYHNYMFSSEEATLADEEVASQFEIFKSNMGNRI